MSAPGHNGAHGARGSAERARALRSFVESFFQNYGASVSPGRNDEEDAPVLEVRLPPPLVEHFRADTMLLTTSPRQREAEIVVPGSRVFDLMARLSQSLGSAAWVPLSRRHAAPAHLPGEVGPSGLLDGVPTVKDVVDFDLELAVRVVFLADQRHEELVLIYVPANGVPVELVESRVAELATRGAVGHDTELRLPSQKLVKERLEAAFDWLRGWTRKASAPREAAVYEQLSREVQRLTNYYGELIAENELDDDVREQLATDLDRRIAEEVAHHRLSVELDLRTYAVIARPRTLFEFQFEVAGHALPATWRFDQAVGEFLAPPCGACELPAERATVCTTGASPHLVCTDCGAQCDVCGAGTCSEHGLVHCHIGGEALCSGCGPRCGECGKPARLTRLRLVDGRQRCERCHR